MVRQGRWCVCETMTALRCGKGRSELSFPCAGRGDSADRTLLTTVCRMLSCTPRHVPSGTGPVFRRRPLSPHASWRFVGATDGSSRLCHETANIISLLRTFCDERIFRVRIGCQRSFAAGRDVSCGGSGAAGPSRFCACDQKLARMRRHSREKAVAPRQEGTSSAVETLREFAGPARGATSNPARKAW